MTASGLSILESGFGLGGYIPRGIEAGTYFSDIVSNDEGWMRLALLEAMEAIGRTSPNPAVGAVLVKDGRLLSKASTQAYGSLHAETMALKLASPLSVLGATCYVTLEPCGGKGKQGPCAEALIAAGIKRVVVAAKDPHEKAGGLGLKKLEAAGIEITLGVLEEEAKAWHFPFLAYVTKQAPIIIGKWAQTLDGHLADDSGHSQWISGPKSRAYTHWLRQKYDAIMVGAQTVLCDKPRLTARDSAKPLVRNPHKIIYDPSGRLATADESVWQNLLEETGESGPLLFWCTENHVQAPKIVQLASDRLVHQNQIKREDWPDLFGKLALDVKSRTSRDLQSIMVEGGSQLLTLLMRADQLDAAHVFVRAGVLGGERNRIGKLNQGDNPSLPLMQRHDYKLIASQVIEDDVVIECTKRIY